MEFTNEQRANGHALIDALRSGEFAQGTSKLCLEVWDDDEGERGIGYCCLGVACELQRRENPDRYRWNDPVYGVREFVCLGADGLAYSVDDVYLPQHLLAAYGMTHSSGRFVAYPPNDEDSEDDRGAIEVGGRSCPDLAYANDTGASFADIAGALEAVYGPRPS